MATLLSINACKTLPPEDSSEGPPISISDTTVSAPLSVSIEEVRNAMQAWDLDKMVTAAESLESLDPQSETEIYRHELWAGTAWLHAALIARDEETENNDGNGSELHQRAISALDRALVQRPQDSNVLIMRAVLEGMAIGKNPLAALTRGPRFLRYKSAAERYGPDNPRVHYLTGASLLNRADAEEDWSAALTHLLQAEALFQEEKTQEREDWEPEWGWDKNLFLIGETYEKLGRMELALEWYERTQRDAPWVEGARRGYERCKQRLAKK